MQAELIHVSRLSAMGAMASTLAHELNQPLAAVSNFVSGAKRIAENPDGAAGGARRGARRRGDRRAAGRRDLAPASATWCRAARSRCATEHLPQLIDEACVLAFIDAEARGIPHRLELDPAAQWVRADRIQIQQVLINLVRNAVEAIGDGAPARDRRSRRGRAARWSRSRSPTPAPASRVDNPDDLFSRVHDHQERRHGHRPADQPHDRRGAWRPDLGREPARRRRRLPLHPAARRGRTAPQRAAWKEIDMAEEQAILAGGCFWCTEAVFKDLIGVSRGRKRLCRRPCRQPDLSRGLRRRHRPCRGDPGHLRSRRSSPMTICSTSFRHPRSDPAQPPGQRRRHPISLGDLPGLARAGGGGAARHRARGGETGRRRSSPRSSRSASGGRPRIITRIIGRAKASAAPIASPSSRPSSRNCARASPRG